MLTIECTNIYCITEIKKDKKKAYLYRSARQGSHLAAENLLRWMKAIQEKKKNCFNNFILQAQTCTSVTCTQNGSQRDVVYLG